MKRLLFLVVACAALAIAAFAAQTSQTPAPSADPYANNARPGTTQFPLAAPAGEERPARGVAPPRAIHQSPLKAADLEDRGAVGPPPGAKNLESGQLQKMRREEGDGGAGLNAGR